VRGESDFAAQIDVRRVEKGMPRVTQTHQPGAQTSTGRIPRLALVFWRRWCDKENHGWCEGLPLISLPSSIRRLAFTLLYRPVSNEKRTMALWGWRSPLPFRTLAGI
jgi:hypothetical protein